MLDVISFDFVSPIFFWAGFSVFFFKIIVIDLQLYVLLRQVYVVGMRSVKRFKGKVDGGDHNVRDRNSFLSNGIKMILSFS